MSLNALTVVLEKDLREEDAQPLIDAILQLRGVLSVTPNTVDLNSIISDARARRELGEKLFDVIYPKAGKET